MGMCWRCGVCVVLQLVLELSKRAVTFPFAFLYWETAHQDSLADPYNYLYTLIIAADHLIKRKSPGRKAVDLHLDFRPIFYSVKISASCLQAYSTWCTERTHPVRLHYARPSNGTGREPRSGHGCNRHHVKRFRMVAKQEGVNACYSVRSTICSNQL